MNPSESKTLAITINQPANEVYEYVSNAENLPRWASGLANSSVNKAGDHWLIDSPSGPAKLRFAEHNTFGVLDHWVVLESGGTVYVPMRVVANGTGAEVVFTLFRQPQMSDADFGRDVEWVQRDLATLKEVLEKRT